MKCDSEKALEAAGSWGLFQKLLVAQCFFYAIPTGFSTLHFALSHFEPTHHCRLPEKYYNFSTKNESLRSMIFNSVIPKERNRRGDVTSSKCTMYKRNYSEYSVESWPRVFSTSQQTYLSPCTNGTVYSAYEGSKTVIMEFSLVCDDDLKGPAVVSLNAVGMCVGSLIATLADRLGRRPILLCACVVQTLALAASAASWNFVGYCVSAFASGAGATATFSIAFIVATESTSKNYRNAIAVFSFYSYALSFAVIAAVGYLLQDWRLYLGVLAVTTALIYMPSIWLLSESPRWLLEKGKTDQAIAALRKIAKMNGKKELFEAFFEEQKNEISEKMQVSFDGVMESFRVLLLSGIAGRFLTCAFGWFVSALMYFAISIFSTDFSNNRFLNLFYAGISEIPGFIAVQILVNRIGRVRTVFLVLITASVSTIILPFLPQGYPILTTSVAVVGKATVAAMFYGWYLISSEILPTLHRSTGVSICSSLARIATIIAPYLMYARKSNYFAPNLAMGIVAAWNALLTLWFVPEMKDVTIPDTVEESRQNERFYKFNLLKKFKKSSYGSSEKNQYVRYGNDEEV